MKMKVNLGVSAEAMLKHPTTCFRLSQHLTRVSDALTFGKFYVNNTKTSAFLPRDLDHISASVHGSGGMARLLGMMVEDPELKKEIESYRAAAERFNSRIRESMKAAQKDIKAGLSKAEVEKGLDRLGNKLSSIEEKVEDLCTVNSKVDMKKAKDAVEQVKNNASEASTPRPPVDYAIKGRWPRSGMAGSGTPKKRPIYPRYFVASMGRSRR